MAAPEAWRGAFDAWERGPILAGERTAAGTINETTRIATAGGDFFLRAYSRPDRAPGEHAIIAHVRARGVPAVAPLPLPDGRTWLDRQGVRYALFPRAEGRQLAAGALGRAEIAAMGRGLAGLHRALRDYPAGELGRRGFRADRTATLAGIARLEAAIGERPGDDPLDAPTLAHLASRRAWLAGQPDGGAVEIVVPGDQVTHGDFQQTNLFFAKGRLTGIIDWDQCYVASSAWEIARVLDYVLALVPAPCRAFLDAYHTATPLDDGVLDRAVARYGLMRAHDLWLFEEYYLRGNRRIGQFLPDGPFVPLAARWAAVRRALDG